MTLATATCVCGGVHLEAADELPPDPRLPYPVAHPTSHGAVSRCLACGHVTIDDAHRDAERAVDALGEVARAPADAAVEHDLACRAGRQGGGEKSPAMHASTPRRC